MSRALRHALFCLLFACALLPTLPPSGVVHAQGNSKSAELSQATALLLKAIELRNAGRYDEALPLAQKALALREKHLGKHHGEVATSLFWVASIYNDQGKYSEALRLYQRALSIYEAKLGKDHPDVAITLNNIAVVYDNQGKYSEALRLYKRALSIKEAKLGKDHPEVATTLHNIASVYENQGKYSEALRLYQRALSIDEAKLGKDHPEVATTLNNIAVVYRAQGKYSEALRLYQRALSIQEAKLGKDHPEVAATLYNIASVYDDQGKYSEALRLYKRALSIKEAKLGKDHPSVATTLHNIAAVYKTQGKYSEALRLYKRALSIEEAKLGKDHPSVATTLHNIAVVYRAQGKYSEALRLYKRALSIYEAKLGKDHPSVAATLYSIAVVYQTQGKYSEALRLYKRALSIEEAKLGKDHPSVAITLNNIALVYKTQGKHSEALRLYQRALSIEEAKLGKDHPSVAVTLSNMAALYRAQGKRKLAVRTESRAAQIIEQNLGIMLTVGSERDKRAYMDTLRWDTHRTISLHVLSAPKDKAATRLALETVLRRKGRVLDATAASMATVRAHLTPAMQAMLDELEAKRSALAKVVLTPDGRKSAAENASAARELRAQIERLEKELARASEGFVQPQRTVTVAAVARALPKRAVLVEVVWYRPFYPERGHGKQWPKDQARYAAYSVNAKGEVRWADLGAAKDVDTVVDKVRKAFSDPRRDSAAASRLLYDKVVAKLIPLVGKADLVFLSPDGALNLVPLEAAQDAKGRYWIERQAIGYVTSGRDLLRFAAAGKMGGKAVVVAAPSFGRKGKAKSSIVGQRSIDLRDIGFEPLPGTEREAKALQTLLKSPTVLTGKHATETAVKELRGPSILHVATHGFFLNDLAPANQNQRGLVRIDAPVEKPAPADKRTTTIEDPLLRSGLAFAGANAFRSGNDDGFLTALEATGLDLFGTELVVLSACDTGVGSVKKGQGVYGLRRALVVAGSQTQVMSLWRVADSPTQELMTAYYKRLLRKREGRVAAMRAVKRRMLKDNHTAHPYFWASFIVSGNAAPLTK